jgi:hypothetical protein
MLWIVALWLAAQFPLAVMLGRFIGLASAKTGRVIPVSRKARAVTRIPQTARKPHRRLPAHEILASWPSRTFPLRSTQQR